VEKNSDKYKIYSLIAQEFFCIPATSVPSEQIFSKAGNIISKKKRAILSSKMIDQLLFLAENKNNIKKLRFITKKEIKFQSIDKLLKYI